MIYILLSICLNINVRRKWEKKFEDLPDYIEMQNMALVTSDILTMSLVIWFFLSSSLMSSSGRFLSGIKEVYIYTYIYSRASSYMCGMHRTSTAVKEKHPIPAMFMSLYDILYRDKSLQP